ncbi:CaiB/BaiF CoA transferase family protein [Sneathiella limimaris]|uniref:CaiB/BaiF CoA transferase family protein n=1 Tax=Sneathiella limimaris TaxID=1964213 RepID=UPI00146AA97E|nr:CoA transferase [Sneathiella limimaris]
MALSKQNKAVDGPLSGLLVVDTSQGIAGPYCASLLAQYGARVIKVDPPHGDWGRNVGRKYGTSSVYSVAFNRGKEGLMLDLKKPDDMDVLYQMVGEADIFLESSRPGVADKIGIGFEKLKSLKSDLIYLSVSGFGQKGAYSKRPCTDSAAQAYSGFMAGNVGVDGIAHKFDIPIIDILTGLYAFQSVSMALFNRNRTTEAQFLDNSLVLSALEVQKARMIDQQLHGVAAAKLNVPSGNYWAKDGELMIALATEDHYIEMAKVLAVPDLIEDPRFEDFGARAENDAAVRELVQGRIEMETVAYWVEKLGAAGLICNKVNSLQEAMADPVMMESGLLRSVTQHAMGTLKLPALPLTGGAELDAPDLGEQSAAIRAELQS